MRPPFFCWIFLLLTFSARAQIGIPVQTLKGVVLDQALQTPLAGATVQLTGPVHKILIADSSGKFRVEKIPVGRYSLQISFTGYKTASLNGLILDAGKELQITATLEDEIIRHSEVVVKSGPAKSSALNQLAMVSTRMFSVDETSRFAASINDPSRMATAFAGVVGYGNGNALIIRGNAPNGLLWRMEGVDIPNPNHFASVGTSGGGVSILSAQLLSNSDFMTSAFPAEYGNALSGVFDIRLRKGNAEKREFTFSASTIGVDAAAEGYFKKGYGGSYLVNYRYGFLTMMQKLGIRIGDAATSFQDLSFNIHLPTKHAGSFTIFGFGGLSDQTSDVTRDSITFAKDPSQRNSKKNGGNTGAVGFTHTIRIGSKTLLKSIYSINGYQYIQRQSKLDTYNGPLITQQDNRFTEWSGLFSMQLTHKFNSHHLLTTGAYTAGKGFDLVQRELSSNTLYDKVRSEGSTRLTQYYATWKWDPVERLSFQAGLHGQYFALNRTQVIEPRLGIRYRTSATETFSFGVGLHSQIQPLGNYFARIKTGTDTTQPNRSLGFTRSLQYVAGYNNRFAPGWNLKTELYYQWLFDVPVTATKADSYSLLNQDDDYAITTLANMGSGKNYGLEFTIERYRTAQFYLISSFSLFTSKYLPSDKTWRDARFNTGRSFTLLFGKEWNLKKKTVNTFSADLRFMYNGGVRVTPIDLAKSIAQKSTVLDNTRAYAQQLGDFFRIDGQVEWRFQHNHTTSSLIAGAQNLLNRKIPVSQSFDAVSKNIQYRYLLGFIPVIGYKIQW
jgi:hypothetical protein